MQAQSHSSTKAALNAALRKAIERQDLKRSRALLNRGAKPDKHTLFLAVASPQLLKLLLEHGADPNSIDAEGEILLVSAVNAGNPDAVRLLLEHGAKADKAGKDDVKALEAAIEQAEDSLKPHRNSLAIIKLLLDHGADRSEALEDPLANASPDIASLLRTGKIPAAPTRSIAEPTQNLLALAKPVLKANLPESGYLWLSDQKLLLPELVKPNANSPNMNFRWRQHDLTTGQETIFKPLAKVDPEVLLSPDGKWALKHSSTTTETTETTDFLLYSLEGAATVKRSVDASILEEINTMITANEVVWMRDSRRWLWHPYAKLPQENLKFYLYGLDSSELLQTLTVTLPKHNAAQESDPSIPSVPHPTAGVLLGITADGLGLWTSGENSIEATDHLSLYTFRLDQSSTAQEVVVALPVHATAIPILSPTEDRIVWRLYMEGERHDTIEIWVSRTDGSEMHALGKQEVAHEDDGNRVDNIQWMPGGKSLSFSYKDKLYLLPVGP